MANTRSLKLAVNASLKAFLESVSHDAALQKDVTALAAQMAQHTEVDWADLKAVSSAWRACHGGSAIVEKPTTKIDSCSAPSIPEPSQNLNPALRKILEDRKKLLEQQQYNAMVSDVTGQERKAAAAKDNALSSFRHQLAFALHVITLMATFFGLGFWLAKYVTSSFAVRAMIGVSAMLLALLLETSLYIVREIALERPVPPAMRRQYITGQQSRQVIPPREGWLPWLGRAFLGIPQQPRRRHGGTAGRCSEHSDRERTSQDAGAGMSGVQCQDQASHPPHDLGPSSIAAPEQGPQATGTVTSKKED